ncbi:MAG: hypothetical protein KN64_06205 [Sulfurovum sp. AS07-7]|nr:MAG: hypothetical protein KN64_06205 [Sulfurovum sp. AS07-7]TQV62430.1 MAG: DUF2892 domain-containing protein [Sulfurovum sp.]
MDIVKLETMCRPARIVVGLILIALGFYTGNDIFLIGFIPLVVGIAGWRPFCYFTKKCSFKE